MRRLLPANSGGGVDFAPGIHHQTPENFSTKTELQILTEKAIEDGRKSGYEAGYKAGNELGYQEGTSLGHKEALQQGQEKIDQAVIEILAPMKAISSNFEESLKGIDGEIANRLGEIALKVGQKLALSTLPYSADQISALIRDLVSTEPEIIGRPKITLNPEDSSLLEADFTSGLRTSGWLIVEDPTLARGSCRVVSDQGELDATLETRWQHLFKCLTAGT